MRTLLFTAGADTGFRKGGDGLTVKSYTAQDSHSHVHNVFPSF